MLNELAKEIHQNAVDHGFWHPAPTFGEVVALCHSELSEALEEYRAGRPMRWYPFIGEVQGAPDKPEGIATEMADCLIRILDWAASAGLDFDAIVREKVEYNKTRPYRHGGKIL